MKTFRFLAVALSFLPFLCDAAPPKATPQPAEPAAVEMLADAPFLQPTSTLEFRFARPMITRDEIGLTPKTPPIVIAPAVPGTFTWLSRSSGVFVPEKAW